MKQFFSYLGASLAAIAALASCNKELEAPIEDLKGGVPFEICASTADTKTSIDGFATSWVAGDAINLFHAEARTTTYISDGEFTISAENLPVNKFKGTLDVELTAESYDWYAFYPYSSYNKTPAGSSKTDFGYTTIGGTTQTQTGNNSTAHLAGEPCPLYGVVKSVASNVTPKVEMNHLTSIIEVNVTNNSGKALTVSNVSFTGTEDIVGTYYVNFAGAPVVYTKKSTTEVSNTVSLSVANGTAIANGASAQFYIAVKPFTAPNGQTLKVSVNGYSKDIPLTKDVTFTAGKIKKVNFKYDKEPEVYTLVQTDGAFEDGGKYVFAFKNGTDDTYYFISNGGTTNNLSKSALTVSGGKITDPSVSYVFIATADASGYKLVNSNNNYINNTSKTTLNTNSNTAAIWYPTFISASKTYKLSQGSTTGRYISYGTKETEAKGYTNDSFKDQIATKVALTQYCGAISVFKLGYSVTLDPAILADNVTGVSARGLSAVELTCNIENPVDDWTLSATCDGDVVTKVEVVDGVVRYSVGQNLGESRDGWITLTYGSVSKKITVSQLAPVFKVSRTSVELEAAAGSSSTITVTSDFDWMADASTEAGFTFDPTTCEWSAENPYTDGKTMVTIKASAENASVAGTINLGTLTFTNVETEQTLKVTVTQKTSYVSSDNTLTYSFSEANGWVVSEGATKKTNYWALLGNTLSITSPSITCSSIKSIVLTARTYGGPTSSQATIQVKFGDTVLGTVSPTSKELSDYTINGPFTGATGSFVVSCPNSTSDKGSGISNIVVTYE